MKTDARKGNITLVPAGGLGNRMKAISAAVRLAEACGSRLRILWFRDWGLGCRFGELFQPIDNGLVTLDEAHSGWLSKDTWLYDRPRRRNFHVPHLFQRAQFDARMDEIATTRGMHEGFDFTAWARGRNVWMASNVFFLSETIPQDAFDLFRPTAKLQARIDQSAQEMGTNVVGVHIRRTDNERAIENSPTEAFVERMRQESADTHFYVATDDEGVKQLLRQEFPNRVSCLPRQAERGSLRGMEDALVEMYLLSRCRHLIGSSCSTYSMTAAAIGRIPLETIERRRP